MSSFPGRHLGLLADKGAKCQGLPEADMPFSLLELSARGGGGGDAGSGKSSGADAGEDLGCFSGDSCFQGDLLGAVVPGAGGLKELPLAAWMA